MSGARIYEIARPTWAGHVVGLGPVLVIGVEWVGGVAERYRIKAQEGLPRYVEATRVAPLIAIAAFSAEVVVTAEGLVRVTDLLIERRDDPEVVEIMLALADGLEELASEVAGHVAMKRLVSRLRAAIPSRTVDGGDDA